MELSNFQKIPTDQKWLKTICVRESSQCFLLTLLTQAIARPKMHDKKVRKKNEKKINAADTCPTVTHSPVQNNKMWSVHFTGRKVVALIL